MNLDAFLNSHERRAWVQEPGIRVYVRRGLHVVLGEAKLTLDLANFIADEPRRHGAMRAFFKSLPLYDLTEFAGLYVENVEHVWFMQWLESKGFLRTNVLSCDACYFLPLSDLETMTAKL